MVKIYCLEHPWEHKRTLLLMRTLWLLVGGSIVYQTTQRNRMKELLCYFALPLTCGMAVSKALMCQASHYFVSLPRSVMRVMFTSHWNVIKNSNHTVIPVWNILWHILLRWEKSCYIQTFCPTQPKKLIQSRLTSSSSSYQWDRTCTGPVSPAAGVSWHWNSSLSQLRFSFSPGCI